MIRCASLDPKLVLSSPLVVTVEEIEPRTVSLLLSRPFALPIPFVEARSLAAVVFSIVDVLNPAPEVLFVGGETDDGVLLERVVVVIVFFCWSVVLVFSGVAGWSVFVFVAIIESSALCESLIAALELLLYSVGTVELSSDCAALYTVAELMADVVGVVFSC